MAGIRAKKRAHDQDSGAKLSPEENILIILGSLRDVIRLLMSLPTLRETRASMTTASLEVSTVRVVDDEPNHLAREWLDAVHLGDDAPRILLAQGPATASPFATRPTRLMFFQGLAKPFPLRV